MTSSGNSILNLVFTIDCLILAITISTTSAQVVKLTHPEENRFPIVQQTNVRPKNLPVQQHPVQLARPKFVAKPGNVIVHFDRNHEIQQLQYVMRDGRLATLYQRHPQHPDNIRPPAEIGMPRQMSGLFRRQETNPAATVAHDEVRANQSLLIDHESTIEVLNDKLQTISHLVGDHRTIPLTVLANSTTGEHLTATHDLSEDDKLEILATIARDTLHVGADFGDTKMRMLLDKLKNKISKKMHELPDIVVSRVRNRLGNRDRIHQQKAEESRLALHAAEPEAKALTSTLTN